MFNQDEPVRILLIEDDPDDYILTRSMLSDAYRSNYRLDWESNYESGLHALLTQSYHVVLLDFDLGEHNGLDLLKEASTTGCQNPVIMMTGAGSYRVDIEAMKAGAVDYISKAEASASLLERTIRYAIERRRSEKVLAEMVDSLAKINAELNQERSRLNAFIQNAPVGIVFADAEGNYLLANSVIREMFGANLLVNVFSEQSSYSTFNVDGMPLKVEETPIAQALSRGDIIQNGEYMIHHEARPDVYLHVSSGPVRGADGAIDGAVAIMLNITDRKLAEQERRHLEARQLEYTAQMEVQRRLLEHREMERQQIARDLHDGPVQDLISLMFTIKGYQNKIDDPDCRAHLDNVNRHVESMVEELREFFKGLRPPALVKFGLQKAIESHAAEFQEGHPGIRIQLDLADGSDHLADNQRLALFRIYQESINNVLRHSNAQNIRVSFETDSAFVRLKVCDDGAGFLIPEDWLTLARSGHLGLVGMKERAEAIGGILEVESEPGNGTTLLVTVPRELAEG